MVGKYDKLESIRNTGFFIQGHTFWANEVAQDKFEKNCF